MLTDIMSVIKNTLQNIGVYVNEDDVETPLDVLIPDSITYVLFIVELERALQIEIPDEFLRMDTIQNLNELAIMISSLKQQETV